MMLVAVGVWKELHRLFLFSCNEATIYRFDHSADDNLENAGNLGFVWLGFFAPLSFVKNAVIIECMFGMPKVMTFTKKIN